MNKQEVQQVDNLIIALQEAQTAHVVESALHELSTCNLHIIIAIANDVLIQRHIHEHEEVEEKDKH